LTLPILAMRPMSLRARSISIRCSARSFSSAFSSASSRASSSGVAPRGRVPASGRIVTLRPPPARFGQTLLAHQDLRAGADDVEVAHVVVVHVRRRVQRAQRAVQRQRAFGVALAQPLADRPPACSRRRRCTPWRAPPPASVGLGEVALHRVRRAALDRRRGDAVAQLVTQLGQPRLARKYASAAPGRPRRSGTAGPRGCR
jgi:hypothetical protein